MAEVEAPWMREGKHWGENCPKCGNDWAVFDLIPAGRWRRFFTLSTCAHPRRHPIEEHLDVSCACGCGHVGWRPVRVGGSGEDEK
jgi:hypothetical protein